MEKRDPKMIGFRRVGGASLRLRVPKGLPEHMQINMREVVELKTAANLRKRGYATTLMHSVCREADRHGRILLLYPKAFHLEEGVGLDDGQLHDWYTRSFGFMPIQANPILMARMVGATPQATLKLNPAVEAIVIGRMGQPNV